jgi:hypothetical protein
MLYYKHLNFKLIAVGSISLPYVGLTFVGRSGVKPLPSSANIGTWKKTMTVTNTLAYYGMEYYLQS